MFASLASGLTPPHLFPLSSLSPSLLHTSLSVSLLHLPYGSLYEHFIYVYVCVQRLWREWGTEEGWGSPEVRLMMDMLADPRCLEAASSGLSPGSLPFISCDIKQDPIRVREEGTLFWTVPPQMTHTLWVTTLSPLERQISLYVATLLSSPRHCHQAAAVSAHRHQSVCALSQTNTWQVCVTADKSSDWNNAFSRN